MGPRTQRSKAIRALAAWVAAGAISVLALYSADAPFVWVFVAGAIALFATALALSEGWVRVVVVNLAFILPLLAGVEYFFYQKRAKVDVSREQTAPYREPHPVYGIVGKRDARTQVTLFHAGRAAWVATYQLDGNGLRITPPASANPPKGCAIFFGCSFTFGDGVQDTETLPYRVAVRKAGQYGVVNLAVGGAGAHQMLSQLEEGLIAKVAPCTPTHGIYTALPHHVYRSAGKPAKYHFGTRYTRTPDGRLVRSGMVEDQRGQSIFERSRILAQLTKSHAYQEYADWPRLTDEDVATYVAIVKQSERLFLQRYPQAAFDVVLWDDVPFGETDLYRKVLEGLRAQGLRVHPVIEVFPQYRADRAPFQLTPFDRHPSPLAYEKMSEWVAGTLLADKPAR